MSHWVDLWRQLRRHRSPTEARRELRISVRHPVLVCGLDAKGHFFAEEDTTVNVSPSGCCFRAACQPMAETVVSIKPRNPAGAGPVCAGLYQVVWTREESDGAVLIGSCKIQFEQS